MQKVYILSKYDCVGEGELMDGVYSVFTSLEKAKLEACKYIESFGKQLLDYYYNDFDGIWSYFSNKATYHIKSMRLDDSCFD